MRRPGVLIAAESLLVLALTLFVGARSWSNYAYFEGSPVHYVNPVFGLDVAVPSGFLACQSDAGVTTSHGFWIPLPTPKACETELRKGSFISFYVGFEAVYDSQSPQELAEDICGSAVVDFPELRIPGHETVVCRESYLARDENGKLAATADRIRTMALTLAPGRSRIELGVSLITTEQTFPRDVEVFKQVLSGIKLAPKPLSPR